MVDSIQRQSSIPLPTYQTGEGSTNPTTVGSAKQTSITESTAKTTMREEDADSFGDYLDGQQQITELKASDEKSKGLVYDPVQQFEYGSAIGTNNGRPVGT